MGMQMTLLRGRDMRMPGRLEQVEHTLHAALGGALLGACPELAYTVNELLFRFMRTSDSLALLWQKLDSALFNSVYQATGGKMRVTLDNGEKRLVTSDMLRDLSDRLLLCAHGCQPDADRCAVRPFPRRLLRRHARIGQALSFGRHRPKVASSGS